MSTLNNSTSSRPAVRAFELEANWRRIIRWGTVSEISGAIALLLTLLAGPALDVYLLVLILIVRTTEAIAAFGAKSWGYFRLWLLVGVLYLVMGIVWLLGPFPHHGQLGMLLGTPLVASGILRAFVAMRIKRCGMPALATVMPLTRAQQARLRWLVGCVLFLILVPGVGGLGPALGAVANPRLAFLCICVIALAAYALVPISGWGVVLFSSIFSIVLGLAETFQVSTLFWVVGSAFGIEGRSLLCFDLFFVGLAWTGLAWAGSRYAAAGRASS